MNSLNLFCLILFFVTGLAVQVRAVADETSRVKDTWYRLKMTTLQTVHTREGVELERVRTSYVHSIVGNFTASADFVYLSETPNPYRQGAFFTSRRTLRLSEVQVLASLYSRCLQPEVTGRFEQITIGTDILRACRIETRAKGSSVSMIRWYVENLPLPVKKEDRGRFILTETATEISVILD